MWYNLEDTMLNEISQSQNDKYYLIPLIWSQIHRESRMVVARGWGAENEALLFNGYRVSVLQDEKEMLHNNLNIFNTDLYT